MKTILEVVVGSTVHGTSVDDGLEDLDIMSVVLEDAVDMLGFVSPPPEGVEGPVINFKRRETWVERTKPEGVRSEAGDVDHVKHGLRKFIKLALRNNPSVLLAFFTPPESVRYETVRGVALRNLAPYVICRDAYLAFQGYLHQQRERMMDVRGQKNVTRPELIAKYGYDTKYAGHIIRLGYQGVELLRTGRITLPMPETQRQHVIDVRNGLYTLNRVNSMALEIEGKLAEAYAISNLPDRPNIELVERWMVNTYLEHWRATAETQPRQEAKAEDQHG